MQILFLHPSFPAQFKEPARAAAKQGHEIKFLCQTHLDKRIEGVERIRLKGGCSKEHLDNSKAKGFQRTQELAIQYKYVMNKLKENNYYPDLVVSHSGWGCGLFTKEVWPKAQLIAYFEWWYGNSDSELYQYNISNEWLNYSDETIALLWQSNQAISLELAVADTIVTPSYWQLKQLPRVYRNNTVVIKESIEEDILKAKPRKHIRNKSDNFLITYGTRGLEPMRCFPEFINELPGILSSYKNIQISIAGINEIFYGGKGPTLNGKTVSWVAWAKHKLKERGITQGVEFTGGLSRQEYIKWLVKSDLHVYLTAPFVGSWSLKDAIALGKRIIASDVEPVQEYCQNTNAVLTDHRQPGFLLEALSKINKRDVLNSKQQSTKTLSYTGWSSVLLANLHTQS